MMNRVKTVEEQWQSYADVVLGAGLSPELLQAFRLAFYGGVEVVLQYTIHMAELDEVPAVLLLESLHQEMHLFRQSMKDASREKHHD
jgi:hypothetical protein